MGSAPAGASSRYPLPRRLEPRLNLRFVPLVPLARLSTVRVRKCAAACACEESP